MEFPDGPAEKGFRPLKETARRLHRAIRGLFFPLEHSAVPVRLHTRLDNDYESFKKQQQHIVQPHPGTQSQRGISRMSSSFTLTQLYRGLSSEQKQQQLCPNAAPAVSCVRQFNKSSIKMSSARAVFITRVMGER